MNIFVRRILGFGLLGAVASVGALQAGQQVTFHLPFKAIWGKIVMPPGDYSLALPELTDYPHEFLLNGQGERSFILPVSTEFAPNVSGGNDHSYLKLVNIDGVYYVRSYESGPTGNEFTFRVPRPTIRTKFSKATVVTVDVAGE